MLVKLAAKGWIDEAARHDLDEAYVFLRRLEHRLQMVRDEQTHTVPKDRQELSRVARLMGYADAAASTVAARGAHFDLGPASNTARNAFASSASIGLETWVNALFFR